MELNDIFYEIGEEACFQQLAEEAAELSQAASKMARYLHGTNPCADDYKTIKKNLIEEYTDVSVAATVAGVDADYDLAEKKIHRWCERIKNK